MQNVELKLELRDLELARAICASVGASFVETLRQTDTYFRLADGRLKRRDVPGVPSEFIFYARENLARARISQFTIYSENEAAERFGRLDQPVWLVVNKVRDVWTVESTRIHLDQVDRLGRFIEFEALVTPRNNLARCHETVDRLRRAFAPVLGEPLSQSYSDMLALDTTTPSGGIVS